MLPCILSRQRIVPSSTALWRGLQAPSTSRSEQEDHRAITIRRISGGPASDDAGPPLVRRIGHPPRVIGFSLLIEDDFHFVGGIGLEKPFCSIVGDYIIWHCRRAVAGPLPNYLPHIIDGSGIRRNSRMRLGTPRAPQMDTINGTDPDKIKLNKNQTIGGGGYFEIFSYYDVIVKFEKYELIFNHVDNPCEDKMTQICILAKFLGYACTYWRDSNVKQIFLNITVAYGEFTNWKKINLKSFTTHIESTSRYNLGDFIVMGNSGSGLEVWECNMNHWPNVDLSLDHRLRRWPSDKRTFGQLLVFAEEENKSHCHHSVRSNFSKLVLLPQWSFLIILHHQRHGTVGSLGKWPCLWWSAGGIRLFITAVSMEWPYKKICNV